VSTCPTQASVVPELVCDLTDCSPTRSALFSARHEFNNGSTHAILERQRLRLETVTLARGLQSRPYSSPQARWVMLMRLASFSQSSFIRGSARISSSVHGRRKRQFSPSVVPGRLMWLSRLKSSVIITTA
jgi:hypothetical protein